MLLLSFNKSSLLPHKGFLLLRWYKRSLLLQRRFLAAVLSSWLPEELVSVPFLFRTLFCLLLEDLLYLLFLLIQSWFYFFLLQILEVWVRNFRLQLSGWVWVRFYVVKFLLRNLLLDYWSLLNFFYFLDFGCLFTCLRQSSLRNLWSLRFFRSCLQRWFSNIITWSSWHTWLRRVVEHLKHKLFIFVQNRMFFLLYNKHLLVFLFSFRSYQRFFQLFFVGRLLLNINLMQFIIIVETTSLSFHHSVLRASLSFYSVRLFLLFLLLFSHD